MNNEVKVNPNRQSDDYEVYIVEGKDAGFDPLHEIGVAQHIGNGFIEAKVGHF